MSTQKVSKARTEDTRTVRRTARRIGVIAENLHGEARELAQLADTAGRASGRLSARPIEQAVALLDQADDALTRGKKADAKAAIAGARTVLTDALGRAQRPPVPRGQVMAQAEQRLADDTFRQASTVREALLAGTDATDAMRELGRLVRNMRVQAYTRRSAGDLDGYARREAAYRYYQGVMNNLKLDDTSEFSAYTGQA